MKPLRAFPVALNVGTDICQISRVYRLLKTPWRARRFVGRVLTAEEMRTARVMEGVMEGLQIGNLGSKESRKDEDDNGDGHDGHDGQQWLGFSLSAARKKDPEGWKAATFMAGRFAAKEAVIKAHTHRRLGFHDVVIERGGGDGGGGLQEKAATTTTTTTPTTTTPTTTTTSASGPPLARIKTGPKDEMDQRAMISISHDGDYATAVCIGYDAGEV